MVKAFFSFFLKDRKERKVKAFQFLWHFHTDNGFVQLPDLEMLKAHEVKVKKSKFCLTTLLKDICRFLCISKCNFYCSFQCSCLKLYHKCYTEWSCCFLQVTELLLPFFFLFLSLLLLYCVFVPWFCNPHSPAIAFAQVCCLHLCSRCSCCRVPQQFKPPKRQDYSDAGTAVPQFMLTLPPKMWSHLASAALSSPHACSSCLCLPRLAFIWLAVEPNY